MAHAVVESRPVAATPCPAWCLGDHLNDEIPDFQFSGTIHQRKLTVGDVSVTIEETTGASEACHDPVGPVVTDLDMWNWISEESIRNLAAALNAAADLIGVPEVTA